jgi:hypothetical protein
VTLRRLRAAVAASALAAAAAGCGLGEGEATEGEATLTVTRDYGTTELVEATIADPTESDTVIRALDREAEITTRYGGGFVQSINGIEGEIDGGRSRDWFFFVNGIESARGSADVTLRAGDRIWWDYRDWTDALRTPAVVGSWPEPFAQAAAGAERLPVSVECAGERSACDQVAEGLAGEGVDAAIEDYRPARSPDEAIRVLVGPWEEIGGDRVAALLDRGPATSGVFARFDEAAGGETELVVLDDHARESERLGAGAGLVAALREREDPPTWLVSGTDPEGVSEAAERLNAGSLADRYALAATPSAEIPAPVVSGE